MDRYRTKRYVAMCWADALRLAQLDGTAPREIRCHRGLVLHHRTDWWALWSDDQLTTAVGLPEAWRPEGLSADAVSLIDEIWLGGVNTPQCGWALLAQVDQILSCERVYFLVRREFALCQENLTLRFVDNEERRLFRCCARLGNRYQCDLIAIDGD